MSTQSDRDKLDEQIIELLGNGLMTRDELVEKTGKARTTVFDALIRIGAFKFDLSEPEAGRPFVMWSLTNLSEEEQDRLREERGFLTNTMIRNVLKSYSQFVSIKKLYEDIYRTYPLTHKIGILSMCKRVYPLQSAGEIAVVMSRGKRKLIIMKEKYDDLLIRFKQQGKMHMYRLAEEHAYI
jgi:hypothetical protein